MLFYVDIVYKDLREERKTVEVSDIEKLDDIVQPLLTDDVNYIVCTSQDEREIIQWTFEAKSDIVCDGICCLF